MSATSDRLPSLASQRSAPFITDHEAVDCRDWGMRPGGHDLVVQTLYQEDGYAMTLLALDRQDGQADHDD